MRRILMVTFTLALCASVRAQTPTSTLPAGTPLSTDEAPYVDNTASPKILKRATFANIFGLLTPTLIGSSSTHGSGSKFQLFTGTFSANDCAKFDASGNIVTNGAACANGTVTGFSANVPGVFYSVSVVNPTTTPALTFSLLSQSANCVFAGPASGAAATPSCRPLVYADVPALDAAKISNFNSAASAAAPVQSVFGRTGAVVAAANDYNFNQLAGSGSTSQQPSTTVNSVVNDTNVQGSISAQALTLSWAGTLAKARQHSATVYNDQANTFGAFVQTFQAGANFILADPTDTTKKFKFDLSNVAAGNTRTVNIPDANSTTAQAQTCTNQVFISMSAQGVFGCSSVANAMLANSSVTINGTANQINGGGPVSLGGSLTLSLPQSIHTSATPQFLRLGLNQAADATAPLAITGAANNITLFQMKRATDTSPAGNFLDFQSNAGASLWKVDATGSLAAGVVPVGRISGLLPDASIASAATWNAKGIANTASESVLAADFSITAASGTFQDSGLSVTLPAAGTYIIHTSVRLKAKATAAGLYFVAKLYNSTDAADVANSETMLLYTEQTGTLQSQTISTSKVVTVTGSKTINLYVSRNGSGFVQTDIGSDSLGRTRMGYLQVQ